MDGFTLARVPRITQAPGILSQLGAEAVRLSGGGPVLLVADPGLRPTGAIDQAEAALSGHGLPVRVFSEVKSDPGIGQIDAAAAAAREAEATLVVALGGGSALDVGKAAASLAPGTASAAYYALGANALPPQPLRKICVPTTSGTGSETTRTVVASLATGEKIWLWGSQMKADLVLLDPTLTVGLPPHLTAATGIDALVHALEACTNANAFAANDLYCHAAIRLVVRHLARAVSQPEDLQARAGMQLAAALAGIAIDNAGTAVAHNIGHALASLRPVHHGRAVGLAALATLPWNVVDDPDDRFAAVAEAMGEGRDATRLPAAFDRLLRSVGVKVSLAGEGHDDLTPERLARQMARPENEPMRRANRRAVTDEDLLAFAHTVLTQA